MRRVGYRRLRTSLTSLLLLLGSATAVTSLSCHEPLDTTRVAPPKATLGDDIYGIVCDRIGASSLSEDLTGASYHSICHYDASGEYGDVVDVSELPLPFGDAGSASRQLSIAKLEMLAAKRTQLIRAFNAVFPNTEIDNVVTSEEGDKIRFHDALMKLGQNLTPLYETNPYDAAAAPLLPDSTRALARVFDALASSYDVQTSLSRMWGRQGYRPSSVALGATRAALSYPRLRQLTKATLTLFGPSGEARSQFEQLLRVAKRELATSEPLVATLPTLRVDQDTGEPNRPRTNMEIASALLNAQDDAFATSEAEASRYITRRDRRGYAVPLGNNPGTAGTVPGPFADVDADGYADVDGSGRFIDAAGAPLNLVQPFAIPGTTGAQPDDSGRLGAELYDYVDTSRSLVAALSRSILPLIDPHRYADEGDPEAYKSEFETIMYQLAGAYVLIANREQAQYDYGNETIRSASEECPDCVPYLRFRGEDSAIADLAHAAGQIIGDKDSDLVLLGAMKLLEEHEDVVARLVGALLRVREIAVEHDERAAQGLEAFASTPYEVPVFDEVAQLVDRMINSPGLLKAVLEGTADEGLITPHGDMRHLGDSIASFCTFKDKFAYDPYNINGPALNLSVGTGSTADPEVPVDRTAPLSGDNRSLFHRTLQLTADGNGVKACNKQGAYVYMELLPGKTFPFNSKGFDECELFEFPDLDVVYGRSLVPLNHPKRFTMELKNGVINTLLDVVNFFADADALLEDSAGITGMDSHPTPEALHRFVNFGSDSSGFPGLPDLDWVNYGTKTERYIYYLNDPIPSVLCTKEGNGTRTCSSADDLLRIRNRYTQLAWERFAFLDYLKVAAVPFINYGCNESVTSCDVNEMGGEKIYYDLFTTFNRHWPGPEHGDECEKDGNSSNARYCSEAGLNRYEPILADALRSDLVPAAVRFMQTAKDLRITRGRGPNAGEEVSGTDVLALITELTFGQKSAKAAGMVDRHGNSTAKWTDGTEQEQLTPFTLMADALHSIDVRFDRLCYCTDLSGDEAAACESNFEECRADVELRQAQWKQGRSQLTDALFTIEGEAESARFKNRATPKMLLAALSVLREQINANCPDREQGQACTWATKDLGDKVATTLSGPLFAAVMDVQEAVRKNEDARRELEGFLTYLLDDQEVGLQGTLTSASDLVQVLLDDATLSPIFRALTTVAALPEDEEGAGAADTTFSILKALVSDEMDQYHVLDYVLPNLVTPMDDGLSPIEVFMDLASQINRTDSASDEPLNAQDYARIMGTVRDFMTSETRGLEQFYFIVQHRPRE